MAYKITEDCINCDACEPECPNEAISEADPIETTPPTDSGQANEQGQDLAAKENKGTQPVGCG